MSRSQTSLREAGAPRRSLLAVTTLAAVAIVASPTAAQDDKPVCVDGEPQIVGVVVDRTNEEPLSTALVSVATTEWASLTVAGGRFQLCGILAGTHRVTVERLGYRTLEVRVDAAAPPAPVLLRMDPDPILLEGLEIVSDRFERRRRAVAYSVRAFDQEEIASSPYWSAADFVQSRAMVFTTQCNGGSRCIRSRGRIVQPTVYLDEMPLIGGWSELEMIPTGQLHMIEVYRRGTHIRAYTHQFMERAARTRLSPFPIWQ